MFRYVLLLITFIIGAVIIFIDWRSSAAPFTDIAFVDGPQYRPASLVDALVLSQLAQEGDRVVKGQSLYTLDSKKHEKITLKLQAERMSLNSELENLNVILPIQNKQLLGIEKAISDTQQMLEYTQSRLTQFKQLGSNVSQTVYDETIFALNTQQQQLNQLNLTYMDLKKSISVTGSRQVSIDLEIQLVDKSIELHKEIKKDYAIDSPVNGVVNEILVKQGEVASSGQALIDIIDYDSLYITAYFLESYLGKIKVGDEVEILFDAYSDPFKGSVLLVGSVAGAKVSGISPNYSSGSYTRLTQKIPVRISFKSTVDFHIALGMSASVSIK